MLARILGFVKKPTSRDILVNTIGNYLNVFFTAFFAFLLVRVMQPSNYGVLSVLLGIAYVLANILDFGTTASIYSYLPPLLVKRRENLYVFLKTILFYQTGFSAIVITLLFIFFPFLDRAFFKTGAPNWELYVTTFSVLFFIWQNYAINALNAAKQFMKSNIFLNLSNLIKTVTIIAMIPLGMINVGSIIFVFGILGPAIFFILLFFDKKHVMKKIAMAPVDRNQFRFGYTITYFIASQFLYLSQRMDLFLLSYFLSRSPEIGYYGLAQKIILTVIASIVSITQVLSPNFSKIKTREEAFYQIRHGFFYMLIPAILFLLLYITPNQVFTLFFTDKFAQTATITKALSLPFIIYVFINIPGLFLLYTVKKPAIILFSNVVLFLVVTIGCLILIPKYGPFGPPYALAIAFMVNLGILSVASLREYRKLPNPGLAR
jgi:O-antigen/teichoic acid export membrane protein